MASSTTSNGIIIWASSQYRSIKLWFSSVWIWIWSHSPRWGRLYRQWREAPGLFLYFTWLLSLWRCFSPLQHKYAIVVAMYISLILHTYYVSDQFSAVCYNSFHATVAVAVVDRAVCVVSLSWPTAFLFHLHHAYSSEMSRWWIEVNWRVYPQRWPSGDMLQWDVGHCVRWCVEQPGRQRRLSTTRIWDNW